MGPCGPPGCQGSSSGTDGSGNFTITGLDASNNWNVLTNTNVKNPPGPFPGCSGFAEGHRYGVSTQGGNATGVSVHVTAKIGEITGTVYGPNGSPMGNVGLVVDNAQTGGYGYGTGTSDGSGHYTIPCLAAGNTTAGSGSYFITAFPPSGSGVSQQQDSGIAVGTGGPTSHDIHLGSGSGNIYGTVTCGGNPCGGGLGVLMFCENCSSSANVTTAANSTYSGSVTGGNTFDVHFYAPSTAFDNQIVYGVAVGVGGSTQVNVNLPAAGPANSGKITGTVSDPGGSPIPDCLINAFGTNSFVEGDTFTDANGHFDTGYRLSPGNYVVFIKCPNTTEVKANGGNAYGVSAGSTVTLSYSTGSEPQRPYTGGSDAIGVPAPSNNAYFAEGFTGINNSLSFHEYLTVQNPNASSETIDVDYLITGASPITKTYTLAAQSRFTINVNQDVGSFQNVSAHIRCNSNSPNCTFVAERPMYFYYPGIGNGGSDVMGATALGLNFYFAEGHTGPGFQEYLTLMNPNTKDANVNVTYFFTGGGQKTVATTVPQQSRSTIDINMGTGCTCDVSLQVSGTNGVSFLAERPMYFNAFGVNGGDVVVGATAPQTDLNLAEGFVGPTFTEYLTFLNPGNGDATATIQYLTQGAGTVTKSLSVPAHSRVTEPVNNDLPAFTSTAVHIHSDQPLVVERPMYFTYQGRDGGHDAMAVPDSSLGSTFDFAEGFVSPAFDEYYTLLNNTATDTTATITFYLSGGGTQQYSQFVGAHTRATVHVNDAGVLGNGYLANSAQITTSGGVKILVERPMYFSY
jgi:hypothetical protein